ncbi:MAG TPA: ABC transporter permease [Candidatus Acidoferrum sp.]|nr:ABC transporter permease [Candidatus Acidoferrum sp.]
MTELRDTNRAMFWRILRRLLSANRGRLFVMLLALGAGAAVTAALLNLQVDAKRRLTSEFRRFGSNILISSRESAGLEANQSLSPGILDGIPASYEGGEITKVGFIYVAIVALTRNTPYKPKPREGLPELLPRGNGNETLGANTSLKDGGRSSSVILVGLDGHNVQRVLPSDLVQTADRIVKDYPTCRIGQNAAKQLNVHPGELLGLRSDEFAETCFVSTVESFGGPEDSQILTGWYTAARLAGPPNRLSVIQLSVPGTPGQIQNFIATLQKKLPDVEVRPIRQFTEGEAKIYNRISGLLTATVGIVLLLTALCVMAAMTNVAIERKMDVGLMKAIGGATRRVVRLFLAEAALLGLAGGLIGAALGILLSIGLGKAVFGVAARPRLIVYPVAVGLTMLVAILSAFPLRRLASIRPASVFRGEA